MFARPLRRPVRAGARRGSRARPSRLGGLAEDTGGVGIADNWIGNAEDAEHWRDSHYRVEAPMVAQMQATFLDNWTKVSGEVQHGADYLPSIEPAANARAQRPWNEKLVEWAAGLLSPQL